MTLTEKKQLFQIPNKTKLMLTDFLIRASYPNYFMVKKYADMGREIFNRNVEDKDNVLKGNKPGTVI